MANWNRITEQGNVTDRRGMARGGMGIVGVIAVVGLGLLFGADPAQLLGELERQGMLSTEGTAENAAEFEGVDAYEDFTRRVLGSLDAYWASHADGYEPAALVLFRGSTDSSCGGAYSVAGPHYCPVDRNIYLDERFFEELQARYGATGGDVAEAYVIAHEVGHHVQNLLGTLSNDRTAEASVETELSADCLAGAWLGSLQSEGIFDENEISEAIDAASAVGDDNIQRRTEGTVQPETWTHGSSADRKRSVMLGYANFEDPTVCIEK
jgi:predicted metalloprotease